MYHSSIITDESQSTLLPAVLIGGPPHSGKTVFSQLLKKSLRQIWPDLPFYLLRANPDGEGDWFNEIDPTVAQTLRQKKEFTPQFASALHQAILHRQVPLLVDVGGKISAEQRQIASACTHAILVSSTEEGLEMWRRFAQEMGLTVLAELHSVLDGEESLETQNPPLRGTLCCLHRHRREVTPAVMHVAHHVANIFIEAFRTVLRIDKDDRSRLSEDVPSLIRRFISFQKERSPIERVVDVEAYKYWEPHMLLPFLRTIPSGEPLAIYGIAPNWVYGALAAWSDPAPIVQFDAVLGWISPPSFELRPAPHPLLKVSVLPVEEYGTYLRVDFAPPYVPLSAVDGGTIPPVEGDFVVLDGKLSMWMWTALVRAYRHLQQIYVYQPQLIQGAHKAQRKAVLVHHREDIERLGHVRTFNLPLDPE